MLNPKAWTDAPPGTFGVSAPYYINNRWQRQPAESLSVGRIFRVKEKYQFQVRAEFQNPFNRVFYSVPASGYATGTLIRRQPTKTPSRFWDPPAERCREATGSSTSLTAGDDSSAATGLATGL